MIQPRVIKEWKQMWRDHYKSVLAKWESEDERFLGHIPNIDPYKAKRGQKVIFNSNNFWTLIHKFSLHCEKCSPDEESWFWVVRYTRKGNGGETQVWRFDNKQFWKKVWDRKYEKEVLEAIRLKNNHWRKEVGLPEE